MLPLAVRTTQAAIEEGRMKVAAGGMKSKKKAKASHMAKGCKGCATCNY